jgi:hypothetical protein
MGSVTTFQGQEGMDTPMRKSKRLAIVGWLVDTPFDMRSKTPPSPLSQLLGEGMIESLYPASGQ